jgi:hypothetical protein
MIFSTTKQERQLLAVLALLIALGLLGWIVL